VFTSEDNKNDKSRKENSVVLLKYKRDMCSCHNVTTKRRETQASLFESWIYHNMVVGSKIYQPHYLTFGNKVIHD
jgi:hypothetical protein